MLGLYRQVNGYRYLSDEAVTGSPDDYRADELRNEAWKIVQGRADHTRADLLESFGLAAAHGHGSA